MNVKFEENVLKYVLTLQSSLDNAFQQVKEFKEAKKFQQILDQKMADDAKILELQNKLMYSQGELKYLENQIRKKEESWEYLKLEYANAHEQDRE